ncbi:MAG: hypothetical protein R2932_57340 [Caldilineaceae bacterium]
MKRYSNFMLMLGLLSILFAACAAPAAAPTTGGEAADTGAAVAEESAATGGTMIWVGHQEVAGLSPSDTGPTVQWAMIGNIHDALVMNDANYELQPYLAESWEVTEDGLQYTGSICVKA